MKLVAAFLIILFLAFSGYHLTFRSFKLPLVAKRFYLTGTEYLFLGLLLGPFFFNLLDTVTLTSLEPFSALLLGWVGLLCGFQFEIRELKRFPKTYIGAALTESVITFSIAGTAAYFLIPLWFSVSDTIRLVTAVTLGATASCTAQTGLALVTGNTFNKRSEIVRFLQFISSINAVAALLFFTSVFFIHSHIILRHSWLETRGYDLLNILIANLGLLLLYKLFLSQRYHRKELILIIIGMVVLTSGAASILQFSPLLANFFIGAFLVNTSREKERIFILLVGMEKPLYILLLFFIGASWVPDNVFFFFFALIYNISRMTGKFTGGFCAAKISYKKYPFPSDLGKGLIEQGGLSLAILFDFYQGFSSHFVSNIMAIAIIGLLINDLISPLFLNRLLDKE